MVCKYSLVIFRGEQLLACAAFLLLAACQPLKSPTDPRDFDAPFALPAGVKPYQLDATQTIFDIKVYRSGALASFGHNHVVSAGSIDAQIGVADQFERSTFELRIPVNEFVIDDPQNRARYGDEFAAPVDADAIVGTRNNMLGPEQLDAVNWPVIVVRSSAVELLNDDTWAVDIEVMLRGNRRSLTVPLTATWEGDRLVAATEFTVQQSDLGLTPFAVMLGALQVADELDISIRLSAIPAE